MLLIHTESIEYLVNSELGWGRHKNKIVTMNAPICYNLFVYRDAGIVDFKAGILKFCGVKPVRVTKFGQVKYSSEPKRKQWVEKVRQLGEAAM